jgi:hypothetical protein
MLLVVLGAVFFAIYLMAEPSNKTTGSSPLQPATERTTTGELAEVAKQRDKQEAADKELERHTRIAAAKEAVKERLREPKSAEFRNVLVVRYQDKINVVCGEVNAKNGLGGMTGYQPFLSLGAANMTWLQSETKDFAENWNKFCAGK